MKKVVIPKMIIDSYPPLVVISGPTASGKTKVSILLSKVLEAEILSFDSRQFYKEMSIGTAKPSPNELSLAPHHFIGHKSIQEEYQADLFSQDGRKLIQELSLKKKPIILVGGSGLYLDALLYGFDAIPDLDPKIRESLNQEFQTKGLGHIQNLLREKDPIYFDQVDKLNPQRMIRGLEVCLGTGKPYSSFRTQKKNWLNNPIYKFCLSPPLPILYDRINFRVLEMMEMGLLKEVESLIPYKKLNPLKTVGYSELFDLLENKIDRNSAIELIQQHTRNFAKRQNTWFRRDPENTWVKEENPEKSFEFILKRISFLVS